MNLDANYTWDIETQDWTTFVLGAIYSKKEGVKLFDWRQEEDYVRYLISRTGNLYAHNGGRFDCLWLLDAMRRFGIKEHVEISSNSVGVIMMKVGKAVFLDSWRMYPMKLMELTNGAKQDLSDLCECGKGCGGYCAIRRDMPQRTRKRIISYLIDDVQTLWDALIHFANVAESLGLERGPTIGSTAWKTVQKELGLADAPYDSIGRWRAVRDGYYGGRCEVFRIESEAGHQYDVNSMYPAKIATVPLPTGGVIARSGNAASRLYQSGKAGVYNVDVRVPDMWIPPLPVFVGNRIGYPLGTFHGIYTGLELHYAETVGVKILRIHDAIAFDSEEIIFKNWVDRLFEMRMKCGKDSREGKWLKLVMNSLTGKFGSRCECSTIIMNPETIKPCVCTKEDRERNDGECKCGAYRPLQASDWLFESVVERLQPCAHAEWAGYLTSAARVELHSQLVRGGEDAVYCDTDSCYSENPRTVRIGKGLGEWSYEGPYRDFEALAPKVYRYLAKDGNEKVKAKGIPSNDWQLIKAGTPVEYQTTASLRRPINGKFFERAKTHRTVNRNTGARLLDGKGPRTRPMTYQELINAFDPGRIGKRNGDDGE